MARRRSRDERESVLRRGHAPYDVADVVGDEQLNPADKTARDVAFGQNTDMKRAAHPEELSPAYVFLASPVCSGYITGIVLPVTGSVGAI